MNFKNNSIKNNYKNEVETALANNNELNITNNQTAWDNISKILKQAATNTIGFVEKSKTVVNEDVKELSILQRTIQVRMQSCNDEVTRSFFKQYRNRILTEIHTIITLEENEKVNKAMEDLKDLHDNNKMYQAVKKIKNLKPTENLLIKGKNGLTANPTEQSEIIAEYFKNTFYKNQEPANIIPLTLITTSFNVIEHQRSKKGNKIKAHRLR